MARKPKKPVEAALPSRLDPVAGDDDFDEDYDNDDDEDIDDAVTETELEEQTDIKFEDQPDDFIGPKLLKRQAGTGGGSPGAIAAKAFKGLAVVKAMAESSGTGLKAEKYGELLRLSTQIKDTETCLRLYDEAVCGLLGMPLIPIPSTELPVQSPVAGRIDPPSAKDPLLFLLVHYVGIREKSLVQAFIDNVAADLESLSTLLEIDVRDQMARIEKIHKVSVPLSKLYNILALMHYLQDFARMGQPIPKLVEPADWIPGTTYYYKRSYIDQALQHAKIRKSRGDAVSVWAKANNPGPFTGGTMKFNDWDEKFTIYLDGLPGITGIPLSYVVRDKSPGTYIEENYIQMITALAPHEGPVFQADAHTVHG
jgi:hypothetical protein